VSVLTAAEYKFELPQCPSAVLGNDFWLFKPVIAFRRHRHVTYTGGFTQMRSRSKLHVAYFAWQIQQLLPLTAAAHIDYPSRISRL